MTEEKKHAHFDDDDDDASSSDDSATRERAAAFSRMTGKESDRSVRRFDEYKDYISRSERSIRFQPNQQPLADKANRAVNFHPDDRLISEQEVPPLDEQCKSRLYMTSENWNAIDMDVELTRKRWQNHLAGSIAFDVENNTTRGLECILDEAKAEDRDQAVWSHQQTILKEQIRQKTKNEWNIDKMRQVSLTTSLSQAELAIVRAQEDAEEAVACWQPRQKADSDQKKKGAKKNNIFGGLFRKKK